MNFTTTAATPRDVSIHLRYVPRMPRVTCALLLLPLLGLACATTPASSTHGELSTKTLEAAGEPLCSHRVPERTCTQHHPELVAGFQKLGDWCAEHALPESQCFACHPDLSFEALPTLPASADLAWLTRTGEAVGPLEQLAVPGKVTVFDFFADWCAPCRKVDLFLYGVLAKRTDVAVRKLNVISWDTALAKEHLGDAPSLPHLVVFSRDGTRVGTVSGLELEQLQQALDTGAR